MFLIKQRVDIDIGLRSAMINICKTRVHVSLVTVRLHIIYWNFVCKAGLVAGTDSVL